MSGRFSASERLTRLLAVIPWVARHGGASLDEIAGKFAYPKDDLVSDLTDVVHFVGVPPYTPDTMIEVTIEDERVWIRYADYFNRPMRLTPDEAVALLSAGGAMLDGSNIRRQSALMTRGYTCHSCQQFHEDSLLVMVRRHLIFIIRSRKTSVNNGLI